MAAKMRDVTGLSEVVFSGGVFQNTLLLKRATDLLTGDDFTVFMQQKVPPNDGGISLGQALYAHHYVRE